jgi:hypothetical protein
VVTDEDTRDDTVCYQRAQHIAEIGNDCSPEGCAIFTRKL